MHVDILHGNRALLKLFRVSLHCAFRYMTLRTCVPEHEDYLSKVIFWV